MKANLKTRAFSQPNNTYRNRLKDIRVFFNNFGVKYLIRVSQRVAERAGLEERVTQHKFWRTFGTIVAKQFGIEQARIWLGHSDITTTQRYLPHLKARAQAAVIEKAKNFVIP
jgi:integrase